MQVKGVGQPIRADLVRFRRPIHRLLVLVQRDKLRKDQLRYAGVETELDQRRIERVHITWLGAARQWTEDLLRIGQPGITRRLRKRPGQPTARQQDRAQQAKQREEAAKSMHLRVLSMQTPSS
jgi:hypothetical protein